MGTVWKDAKTGKITGYSTKNKASKPEQVYVRTPNKSGGTSLKIVTPVEAEEQKAPVPTPQERTEYVLQKQAEEKAKQEYSAKVQSYIENKQKLAQYKESVAQSIFERQKLVKQGYEYKGTYKTSSGESGFIYEKEEPVKYRTPGGKISADTERRTSVKDYVSLFKSKGVKAGIEGVESDIQRKAEIIRTDKGVKKSATEFGIGVGQVLVDVAKHPVKTVAHAVGWSVVPGAMAGYEFVKLKKNPDQAYALGYTIKNEPYKFTGALGTTALIYHGIGKGMRPVTKPVVEAVKFKAEWGKVKLEEITGQVKDVALNKGRVERSVYKDMPWVRNYQVEDMTALPVNVPKKTFLRNNEFILTKGDKDFFYIQKKETPAGKDPKFSQEVYEPPRSYVSQDVATEYRSSRKQTTRVPTKSEITKEIILKDDYALFRDNNRVKVYYQNKLMVDINFPKMGKKGQTQFSGLLQQKKSVSRNKPFIDIYTKRELKFKPESDLSFGMKLAVKPEAGFKGFSIQNLGVASVFGEIPRIKQDLGIKSDMKLLSMPKIEYDMFQLTSQVPKIKTKQRSSQKQDIFSIQKLDSGSLPAPAKPKDEVWKMPEFNIPRSSFDPFETPKPEKEIFPFGMPNQDKKFGADQSNKGFDVLVKENKKFIKVNQKPLSRFDALGLGATVVNETVSATFKIKPSNKPASKSEIGFEDWDFLGQLFRKKDQNLFIEKNKFRINTVGEFRGITVKGWLARKRKGLFKF